MPVAALLRARADDTLWAALRVMAFTDEHIRAAVKTGQYTDPAAEKLLSDVLIQRRDKIARVYLAKVNPLVKFSLDGSGVFTFENPAVRARIADAPKGGYQVTWSRFDNATSDATAGRLPHHRAGRTPAGAGRAAARRGRLRQGLGERRRWAAPLVGNAGRRLLQTCRRSVAVGGR